ncbi:MAG: nucleotide sugar dehydrogenase, partial [Actinomycetota bacterium]|nr:nucleotide sugar dehydrogenase [Actinomycetota bacterium]
ISSRMPAYVVSRVQNVLNTHRKAVNGAKVLLLGLTYKPDISDDRETPAREVVRHLRDLGAEILGHDPHVSVFDVDGEAVNLESDLNTALASCDIAVLLQTHSAFDLDHVAATAPLVFDTRGKMTGSNVDRL